MNTFRTFSSSDWDKIGLVVFDVDGTLYRQRPLRIRIVRDLLLHALLKRNLRDIVVISNYRRIRERLGDEQAEGFERLLISETASSTSSSADDVRAIVKEWIEQRPIPYLPACRYPGLKELFAGLRRRGTSIGVLSDYPAEDKLAALELTADYIVSAADEDVGCLKPHPRGLEVLIAKAGAKAHTTLMIGDRATRDGLAAQRVGARVLIRSSKSIEGWQTFATFNDRLFASVLAPSF
jgi:putative hydrolase of the HAD superfamily